MTPQDSSLIARTNIMRNSGDTLEVIPTEKQLEQLLQKPAYEFLKESSKMFAEILNKSTSVLQETLQYISEGALENFLKECFEEL